MIKTLKIVFSKKTSSRNLAEALRLSKKLNGSVEGDIVTVELTVQEVFNLWELVNALLNAIDKWRSFEIYCKGVLCRINKDYRQLFYALQEIRSCYHNQPNPPEDFTKCNPGWGCDKLNFVSLELTGNYKKWFEFGQLDPSGNTWIVDKFKILNEVQAEIDIKFLKVCPAFPLTRIAMVINNLPDGIKLGEEWVAEWSNELVDGKMTKVYSLRYDREFEAECNYVEKIATKIPQKVDCPYPKGSDQWLDWMTAKGYLNNKKQ
ncbi:MAG: hypothetical protein M1292_00805 [Bacteroidetes bacterium]|nr:hypothetical protein [Bacteroidota bacterium]